MKIPAPRGRPGDFARARAQRRNRTRPSFQDQIRERIRQSLLLDRVAHAEDRLAIWKNRSVLRRLLQRSPDMKTTAHLTSTNTEFERQVRKTRVGMAHFAGTGPFTATCGECTSGITGVRFETPPAIWFEQPRARAARNSMS